MIDNETDNGSMNLNFGGNPNDTNLNIIAVNMQPKTKLINAKFDISGHQWKIKKRAPDIYIVSS